MVDNALALAIRPPEIQPFNATAPLLAAAQFQNALTQNDVARFGLMRVQRDDANRQAALGLISSSDPNAATKALSLDPEIGLKIQEFRSKARENEVADFKRQNEMIANVTQGILSAPPEQRSMLYAQERERLVKMGIVKPELVPPVYNEGFLRGTLQRSLTV